MHPFARRLARAFAGPAGALALSGCSALTVAPHVATGLVSHQLCSAIFVAGLDPQAFYAQALHPVVAPAEGLLSHRIDRQKHEVITTFAGGAPSRAIYRGALGCLVVQGPAPAPAQVDTAPLAPRLLPAIAGQDVVTPSDPALTAALDHAFAEPDRGPPRWTKAVVIVRDGRVIAERYAPGYGPDTPIMGWSMTKSVTNALLGILVRQGRLNMDQPAPVAAWSDPRDPHHAITPDSLLRMTSGLDMGQSLTGQWTDAFDPTGRMVFAERDLAGFAERAKARWAPGTRWTYANGNTLLLSRIIRERAGGDAASVYAFAHRELFDKLGMDRVTLEMDSTGTPIGASHMWAPARDWARFGMLYLNNGMAGGERILPEGWVDYSARFTPGSEDYGYGAGFWTNRGDSAAARWRVAQGMPADSFMARGSYGQVIVVIPSSRLVIVRMGYAYTDRGDIVAIDRLVAETVAAVKGV